MSNPTEDFKRPLATALGVSTDIDDGDLIGAIMRSARRIEDEASGLQDELDKAVEKMVDELRLPLAMALQVDEDQVNAKSREVLEKLAELKQRVEAAWEAAEQKIRDVVSQLPLSEDEKEEATAFLGVTGGM